jgi:ABC-type transport system substrate-binding protein
VIELRVFNFEPSGITPPESADQNAVIVVRQLLKGLIEFDDDSGAPVNLIAESVTSGDNRVWTIRINSGYTFSNGEPVTADSFIDSWNFTAYGPHAQVNRGFFERVDGFDELQGESPAASTLRGLRRIDEVTFEVSLSGPYSGFPAMLGYCAFFPMAREHLADEPAHREHPIGNGPYTLVAWEHGRRIALARRDDWGGPPARNDRLTFQLYPTMAEGYAAFEAGEHDLMDNIPPDSYLDARRRFADTIFEQASNSYTYLGVPLYAAPYQNRRIRQAISSAIDRQYIIDTVYDGQYLPAHGVISPNFFGYREDAGEFCTFDPDRARSLLAQAGGWPGGPLVLHANSGGGHEAWLTMIGEQLRTHLGIEYELRADRPFADYFAQAKERDYAGLFRRGWAPDYAWPESYLHPICGRGGSANQQFYDNPEFDDLVTRGNGASSPEECVRLYQAAEDVILTDLPIIPLWFQKTSVIYSKRVKGYVRNIINGSDYPRIEVD